MRVLLLHNRYRAEGGEERAVHELHALLERSGHQVALLERSSQGLGRGAAARALIGGGADPDEVAGAVRRTGAEVVHAHNLHPLLGWRALDAAQQAGAATVLHLHNFRLFCAIAVAYRDDRPCFDCRGANTLPGLAHRCRGGAGEAAVYALGLARQQPGIFRHADRFAVLSDAHGARLHELGLPAGRSDTLPNFIAETGFAPASRAHLGRYALIAGRLVAEKGFDTAIRAAAAARVPLVVAGAGPDELRLRELAAGTEVRFTGWLQSAELAELRAGAGAILVPSRCEEACPYAALDGLAAGVPVLGSDRGGLPELLGEALPADDAGAWAEALGALWGDLAARQERGAAALARARERFGETRYLERLLALYERAIAVSSGSRNNPGSERGRFDRP
jgi:glycosyltransferase involved in cell wall biosynthesis